MNIPSKYFVVPDAYRKIEFMISKRSYIHVGALYTDNNDEYDEPLKQR